MDQLDQVRQPKRSTATWLAHREPMGKRPPTGASIPLKIPSNFLILLSLNNAKKDALLGHPFSDSYLVNDTV